jgi:predicted MFS family arabinose efflux permease
MSFKMKKMFNTSYSITLTTIFATGLASSALLVLKPLIVGGLIDEYHFSQAQAGYIVGIEMVGLSLAAFIVATLNKTWSRRWMLFFGATIGILGGLGPILTDAFIPILVCRFIAGIGCGLIAANVMSVIATTRDPDRTFGLYFMTCYAGAALLMTGGAWSLAHFHVRGIFIFMVLLLFVTYITVSLIPPSFAGLQDDNKAHVLPSFPLVEGGLCLGISMLFWVGLGAVWAFLERLGQQAGVSPEAVGYLLTFYGVAGFAGASSASILHKYFGRLELLIASITGALFSVTLIGWASGLFSFAAGVIIFSYIWPLFLTYMGGIMAAIDSGGRVVAMSVSIQCIGLALGTAIGGELSGRYGYISIPVISMVCFLLALALLPLLTIRLRACASNS